MEASGSLVSPEGAAAKSNCNVGAEGSELQGVNSCKEKVCEGASPPNETTSQAASERKDLQLADTAPVSTAFPLAFCFSILHWDKWNWDWCKVTKESFLPLSFWS